MQNRVRGVVALTAPWLADLLDAILALVKHMEATLTACSSCLDKFAVASGNKCSRCLSKKLKTAWRKSSES